MMIWLRNASREGCAAGAGAGVEHDVLRAHELAELVDMDEALAALQARCDAMLDAAHTDACALRETAQAQAAAQLAEAAARHADAAREGRAAGLRDALADWHARHLRQPDAAAQAVARRERARLAELVVLAVERMVAASDPAELLRRATSTLDNIVADGSVLDVAVHPTRLSAATQAFAEFAAQARDLGRAVRVRVRADAALQTGACLCESELGTVDAGLDVQFEALREALARALDEHSDTPDDAQIKAQIDVPVEMAIALEQPASLQEADAP
ncbi:MULTISPECIES: FliH/SctL family protein [unclassified Paraburkholderia]|uniref:FliH/SctL family protein n=1 Tax=unclassified Paraburkholderia TaxID=2615204 RepID=UPI002AAF51E7|nr:MULTISPECIES: FliH/SctL family protein [unclassified Paraburkholderia]